MNEGSATDFQIASSVRRASDNGVYAAAISPDWAGGAGPNGGYLAALALRAMINLVGDETRPPRSLTCHFLRPVPVGEVEIRAVIERAGRTASFLTARLSAHGRDCVVACGVFAGELASELSYNELAMPADVLAADAVTPLPARDDLSAIFDRIVFRPAIGPAPFSHTPVARQGGWLELVVPVALDAPCLALLCDATLPAPSPMVGSPLVAPTLELTIHFRATAAPAATDGWPVLLEVSSHAAIEGFFDEHATVWSRSGEMLAQSHQIALAR